MTLNHPKIVTLASMGVALDNIDTPSGSPQMMFHPGETCQVFVPDTGKIRHYVVDLPGTTHTDSAPDVHTLYLNALTDRLYSWNEDGMMELMDTSLGMEQFSDATDFNQAGVVYHVTSVHQVSSLTIGDGSTVVFHGQGKFVGTAIEGEDIQFIPDGDNVCFGAECNFKRLKPKASWLRATNFGAVPDMIVGEPHSWTFFDLTCDIQERSGTNNLPIWGMIGSFLTESKQIKLEFNGEFYSKSSYDDYATNNNLIVTSAENLELYGGTHLFYLRLVDCNHVLIHRMSFVGFHTLHDFPTVCINKSSYTAEHPEMTDLCYEPIADKLSTCGLAGDSIHAMKSSDASRACDNIHIEFCHFEMRQGGVCGRSNYSDGVVNAEMTNFIVNDCTFDHMYYQPIGSHCANTTVERVFSNYCMQGVDWATCGNNSVVRDSVFTNCACGPKQDTSTAYLDYSHDNQIINCYFQITDAYNMINTGIYALSANSGKKGDTFKVINSKFVVNSSRKFNAGVVCRCHHLELDKCQFEYNITPPDQNWKLSALFCPAGNVPTKDNLTIYVPQVKLTDCHIINDGELWYLASNYQSGNTKIDIELYNTYIHSGYIYECFNKCNSLIIDSSVLDITCRVFVQNTPTINVANSVFFTENNIACFNLVGTHGLEATIINNVFKSVTKFVNLNMNCDGAITASGNFVNCNQFIVKPNDCPVSVTQSGNVII